MSGVPLSLLGLLPDLQSGSAPGLSPPLFGGGGFIVPPSGGNAAVPPQFPPPTTGNPGIQPDVPAVPEPSTWIILIVGFAICAGAMRRQRLHAQGLRQAA
ncbi:PEP-CTERM sorting domain-containing protein [Parafrankia sp. BMG5.11]|nr:PEP-CTERM sorting domain-containing protein [Parafrankia sp. BMG5.11]